MRHIPAWFPGADFKRFAQIARKYVEEMLNMPFNFVKKARVRWHSSYSTRSSTNEKGVFLGSRGSTTFNHFLLIGRRQRTEARLWGRSEGHCWNNVWRCVVSSFHGAYNLCDSIKPVLRPYVEESQRINGSWPLTLACNRQRRLSIHLFLLCSSIPK